MKNSYIDIIERYLRKQYEIQKIEHSNEETIFTVSTHNVDLMKIKMLFYDEMVIRFNAVFSEGNVENYNILYLQKKINELNLKYRFINISIDEDLANRISINVRYDFILFDMEEATGKKMILKVLEKLIEIINNEFLPELFFVISRRCALKKNEFIELIIKEVCRYYDIAPQEMFLKNRKYLYPRNIMIFLCLEMIDDMHVTDLAALLKRDVTTILHGANKIKDDLKFFEVKEAIQLIQHNILKSIPYD